MHCSYRESCTCALPAGISCGPAPDAPADGQRSGSGTTFESTVNYTCNQGYTLQGDNKLTCMADREWSGSAPTCNRKLLAIRCSTIDIHGLQKSIRAMILQCDDSWGITWIVKYLHFSYNSCTCALPAAVSCGPAPDAPANGQRSGSGTTFRSTVTYSCNPGYTREGHNSITCMAHKRWSGRAPTCNRKLLCKYVYICSTMDIYIYGH